MPLLEDAEGHIQPGQEDAVPPPVVPPVVLPVYRAQLQAKTQDAQLRLLSDVLHIVPMLSPLANKAPSSLRQVHRMLREALHESEGRCECIVLDRLQYRPSESTTTDDVNFFAMVKTLQTFLRDVEGVGCTRDFSKWLILTDRDSSLEDFRQKCEAHLPRAIVQSPFVSFANYPMYDGSTCTVSPTYRPQ